MYLLYFAFAERIEYCGTVVVYLYLYYITNYYLRHTLHCIDNMYYISSLASTK